MVILVVFWLMWAMAESVVMVQRAGGVVYAVELVAAVAIAAEARVLAWSAIVGPVAVVMAAKVVAVVTPTQ